MFLLLRPWIAVNAMDIFSPIQAVAAERVPLLIDKCGLRVILPATFNCTCLILPHTFIITSTTGMTSNLALVYSGVETRLMVPELLKPLCFVDTQGKPQVSWIEFKNDGEMIG